MSFFYCIAEIYFRPFFSLEAEWHLVVFTMYYQAMHEWGLALTYVYYILYTHTTVYLLSA